jgi:putative transcriptional regulator
MPSKHRSDALAAIHETAADLHRVGGMDQKTMRKFDALCLTPIQEMTPEKIRALSASGNVGRSTPRERL